MFGGGGLAEEAAEVEEMFLAEAFSVSVTGDHFAMNWAGVMAPPALGWTWEE